MTSTQTPERLSDADFRRLCDEGIDDAHLYPDVCDEARRARAVESSQAEQLAESREIIREREKHVNEIIKSLGEHRHQGQPVPEAIAELLADVAEREQALAWGRDALARYAVEISRLGGQLPDITPATETK